MRWVNLLALALLILVLGINAPGWAQYVYAWWGRAHVGELPVEQLAAGPVLVLAPHPDDEVLCCAGYIEQARRAGRQVYIVWMTSGDGFEMDEILLSHRVKVSPEELRQLGLRRMNEARVAASVLGVAEDHLFFLGYPDRGLRHLFLDYFYQPYTSPYTRLSAVGYPGSFRYGAPYTGEELERDLREIFERVQPGVVLLPSPRDAHPDHQATSYFGQRVAGRLGTMKNLRYWIVHGGLEWPLPKGYHPSLALEPAPRGKGLEWHRLPLDGAQEKVKHEAVLAHKSQLEALSRFMLAFIRTNELFSTTPFPSRPVKYSPE